MDPELDAMAKVLAVLDPLPPEARERVVSWVVEKLGVRRQAKPSAGSNQPISSADSELSEPLDHGALPSRAMLWMKQNDVSADQLENVFHLAGGEADLILADIPGKTTKDKVLNVYILAGVSQLLISGEPTFTDKFARDMCSSTGCLDTTNHAKYLAAKGNEFSGSKDRGWMLTSPGLKKAAALVKEAEAG